MRSRRSVRRAPRDADARADGKIRAYLRTKGLATALLAAMAALYAVSRMFEARSPALGFVRALAEAAMVGGIADWFAVTALFRHPLHLPLPHTAIIPRNKDRIGDNLAKFVETNFLAPELIAGKLAHIDLTMQFAQWLAQPERSRQIADGRSIFFRACWPRSTMKTSAVFSTTTWPGASEVSTPRRSSARSPTRCSRTIATTPS